MSIEPPHYRISRLARELEKEGRTVIHLEIGDPEIDTDKRIIDAMYRAALEGYTHYGPAQGLPILRERLVEYMEKHIGASLEPDNISTSPGSKVAIYTALRLLNPRRIYVVEPMWGLYHSFAEEIGIEIVRIPTYMEDRWEPKTEFKGLDRGDVVALVNPNNPTGTVLSDKAVEEITEAAAEADAYIVADEVYFDLVYWGGFKSFLETGYDKVLAIYSFSKNYAMSGFRIGWVVSPNKDLLAGFVKRLRLIVGGPAPFTQVAAAEALTLEDVLESNRRFYIEGLKYSVEEMRRMGFEFVDPTAGMYIFAKPPAGEDGVEFSMELLYKKGVAVSPGTAFGEYPDYIRVTTGLRRETLEEAFKRMREFLEAF